MHAHSIHKSADTQLFPAGTLLLRVWHILQPDKHCNLTSATRLYLDPSYWWFLTVSCAKKYQVMNMHVYNLVRTCVVHSTRFDVLENLKGRNILKVWMLDVFSFGGWEVEFVCTFMNLIWGSRRYVRLCKMGSDVRPCLLIENWMSRISTSNHTISLIPPGRYLYFSNLLLTVSLVIASGEKERKLNTWNRDSLIL
jgi:hypothetical protein